MAIRNKDGTIYRLRGPNPLLAEQADWDRSQVRLINMGWKDVVVEDRRNPIKEMKKGVIDIGEELPLEDNPKQETKVVPARNFIAEVNAPPKPKPKPKEPPKKEPVRPKIEVEVKKPDEEVVINADPRLARIIEERSVEYYCAPAIGSKKHTDDLYGTSYETTVFGDQYIFDAVVVDQSDFQLQFWCVKPITKGSIVLRKDKEGGERWWEVNAVEPKSGGYLALANLSDLNPSFED